MNTDVLIVGGGTSGSALAARLSDNPQRKVILLEAGASDDEYPATVRNTALAARNVLLGGKHVARWSQKFPGSAMPFAILRGNTLGGTSAINYMAAVRGMPEDFNGWAAMGCEGWSWEEVLPYFRKIENDTDFGSTALHGDRGPMRIRRWPRREYQGIQQAFYDGMRELGVPAADDINDRDQLPGVGAFPGTVSDDEGHYRLTVSQAYLNQAVRQRENLTIRTRAKVARVLHTHGKTQGVELVGGEKLFAKQVFLCCGAFESPKLLMLSGIGPEDELRKHGIPVAHHLPGVGQRLQDHVALALMYRAPYQSRHRGSPAKCVWIGASDGSNLDFHTMPSTLINLPVLGEVGYTLAFNLHPTTTGRVMLRSANPLDHPSLDLNFLTAEADMKSLLPPIEKLAQWESTSAFKEWGGKRILPRRLPKTIADIRHAKRFLTLSYFHHVGSCAMGPENDSSSVVDTQCRVKGLSGLRVVDASVMPRIIRGNTYLCCVMLAERIAAQFDAEPPQQQRS